MAGSRSSDSEKRASVLVDRLMFTVDNKRHLLFMQENVLFTHTLAYDRTQLSEG